MKRTVHCDDAIEWLTNSPVLEGCSLVASMPDISEFPKFTLTEWKEWFISTAKLILSKTPDEGVCFFYQSDIKHENVWVDKAYLVQKAAEELGVELLWHKVVCRFPAGTITFGRPAYSHMLCFSKKLRPDLAKSTADVLPDIGDKTWERGMGLEACQVIAKFVATQTQTKTLVHPFCGEGGMLAVASSHGLDTIGIERSPKRAEKARRMQISADGKEWVLTDA